MDAATYMYANDMLNNLALTRGRRYTEEAVRYGKRALELSPRRQEAIFYLGRTYVLREEPARAIELNRGMVTDVPGFAVGHWFLGLSLIAAGEMEEGKREILQSKEMGYRLSPSELESMRKYFDAEEFERLRR
jgi:tetratricopeptide (TPR) repeat protein